MPTTGHLRAECVALMEQLDRARTVDRLRRVYMDLAPLMGEIQGAITEAEREGRGSASIARARASMEALRAAARQVGLDIRLSSPDALSIGLRTSIEHAVEVLQALDDSG